MPQADGAALPMKQLRRAVTRVAIERGIDEKEANAAFALAVRRSRAREVLRCAGGHEVLSGGGAGSSDEAQTRD